ncbi:MAG TPA: YbaL family putative K(+) efflux transporter [Gemmatimonadaceae bacterium]|jgi:CPA2 family monovalent cation:H+ antiporter-2|nr:YbaL family putative K(+) efflux transporter [Gemmatimonadaceae bacterium]
MLRETTLIATIAAGLGLAFVFGFLAARLRLPPLVGYLLAGVAVGPFSPGFVADIGLASQLAEIGVILLMFGVGLHFSVRDLLVVRKIAVPGALAHMLAATLLGAALARWWEWSWIASLVFGLSLSVASTVVVYRALEERNALDSVNGRIAVGWLIVEDLAMVLVLVLLPAFAGLAGARAAAESGFDGAVAAFALTLGKIAAFVVLMLVIGRRAVPWLLEHVVRTGSRELFTLAVLAVALGVAVGAAALFGVSFALGAFFAGVVINESDLSHRAGAEALPLQDAFAVLFFVSVGMLFDPLILLERPLDVLAVLLVIAVGKSVIAWPIVLLFGYPVRTASTVAASMAQIGEFSFILAGLGISLGLLPREAQSLIVAGALLSITLNPLIFGAVEPVERWLASRPKLSHLIEKFETVEEEVPVGATALRDHAVIVGHGRVGGVVGAALDKRGVPYVAVERDRSTLDALRRAGVSAIYGDAARAGILEHTHLERARLLVIATPEPYQTRQIIELARRLNPSIDIIARTHSAEERAYLERLGIGRAVLGEHELALSLVHYSIVSVGFTDDQADQTVEEMRAETTPSAV